MERQRLGDLSVGAIFFFAPTIDSPCYVSGEKTVWGGVPWDMVANRVKGGERAASVCASGDLYVLRLEKILLTRNLDNGAEAVIFDAASGEDTKVAQSRLDAVQKIQDELDAMMARAADRPR